MSTTTMRRVVVKTEEGIQHTQEFPTNATLWGVLGALEGHIQSSISKHVQIKPADEYKRRLLTFQGVPPPQSWLDGAIKIEINMVGRMQATLVAGKETFDTDFALQSTTLRAVSVMDGDLVFEHKFHYVKPQVSDEEAARALERLKAQLGISGGTAPAIPSSRSTTPAQTTYGPAPPVQTRTVSSLSSSSSSRFSQKPGPSASTSDANGRASATANAKAANLLAALRKGSGTSSSSHGASLSASASVPAAPVAPARDGVAYVRHTSSSSSSLSSSSSSNTTTASEQHQGAEDGKEAGVDSDDDAFYEPTEEDVEIFMATVKVAGQGYVCLWYNK